MATKIKNTEAETVTEAAAPAETKKKGWRIKEYWVDPKAYKDSAEALKKAPNQVQIMVNHFAKKFDSVDKAAQGRIMCQSAIDEAGLRTVIEPNVLFAYYRKTMETFGLRLK